MYGTSPTYRRHLRENLAQAGYRDDRVRRAAIGAAGKLVAELPAVWFRPHASVGALVREAVGFDEALAERARGRALLFLTPHMGCFEVTAQYAALHMPITVLYRPPKLAWLEPVMVEGRSRGNLRLVPADMAGVRQVIKALARGEAVGLLPDQVPGEGEGEWAEFFGRRAYTMTLAAKLAQRDNVACFLVYGRRLPFGQGYALVVRRLAPAARAGVQSLNRALESLVRECPAQYLWGYNRYKRPRQAPAR